MTDMALMGAAGVGVGVGGRSDMLNEPDLGGMKDPNMFGDTLQDKLNEDD